MQIVTEAFWVRSEADAGAVGFLAGLRFTHVVFHQTLAELDGACLFLTVGLNFKKGAKRIDGLDADAV